MASVPSSGRGRGAASSVSTGATTLVDGTMVTQPRYAFWLEGYEWGVENHGVDPDVEVLRTPADIADGRDPQLERAIDIALDQLAARPPRTRP